ASREHVSGELLCCPDAAADELCTLSLHDALPILLAAARLLCQRTLWLKDSGLPHTKEAAMCKWWAPKTAYDVIHQCLLSHGQYRSEEHTSELQSRENLVCRLLLEQKKRQGCIHVA